MKSHRELRFRTHTHTPHTLPVAPARESRADLGTHLYLHPSEFCFFNSFSINDYDDYIAGVPWTPEEHKRFLLGLSALGKGDWRGISRHYVQTRTPTQVASHAQKYFIRQTSTGNKRKRRTSLFDTTLDTVRAQQGQELAQQAAALGNASNSSLATLTGVCGDRVDRLNPPSVSPNAAGDCAAALAGCSGGLPLGIMPVGILAAAAGKDDVGGHLGAAEGAQAAALQQLGLAGLSAHVPGLACPSPMGLLGLALPQIDPASLVAMMQAQVAQLQHQQLKQGGQQPAGSTGAAQVYKPTAVRYTSKEVQEFKKEWNGSFASNPGSTSEECLRSHISKVYKATKGKTDVKAAKAAQSLSNGNSSSSQTTLVVTSL